jgi:hypothetical protein
VEDDDEDEEAVAEAERDAQLRVVAEAERVGVVEKEHVAEAAEREAAERAAHWAAKIDKALAYRRDIHLWEAACHAEPEHHLERHQTLRRQEAAICAAMAVIDAAGATGNGNGAARH